MTNTPQQLIKTSLLISFACLTCLNVPNVLPADDAAIICGTPITPITPIPPCDCCGSSSGGGPGSSSGGGSVTGPVDGSSSSSGGGAGGGACCKASPCNARSGVYFNGATDLNIAVTGWPLAASRTYSSAFINSGVMGYGWASNFAIRLSYAQYLLAAPSTYVRDVNIRMPDSRFLTFKENPDGVTFTPPTSRTDTLVRNGDGSWTFKIQNSRTVWQFDANGALTTIIDDYGNSQTWSYDSGSRLQRVTDNLSGRYIEVFFGADGRISSVRDNAGRQVYYAYDANGSLTSVTDPIGRVTTYTYTQGRFVPLLQKISDHWGRTVDVMSYDASNRILSYTEDGETYTHDYSHVKDGYTLKKDSLGNTWTIKYASDGNITERVDPSGASVRRVLSPEGLLLEEIDQVGIHTTYTHDSQGRVASMTRDATHNGPKTEYTYHPTYSDKVIAVTVKNSVTNQIDPNWQSWQYDYYGENDPAPGALHHVYRIQKDGVTRDTISTMTYDTRGRLIRRYSASGSYTENTYDVVGNLLSVSNPPNNDAGTRPTTTHAYDAFGRVTSVTDPLGHVTSTTYDALDRPLTVTLPKPTSSSTLDFTTTYSYDNWDVTSGLVFTDLTDPNGKITRQGHDALGRIIKSIDALGNTTTYAFTRGVLTYVTDANSNITGYTYDTNKRLIDTTFPDSTHEQYTYYLDGLLHNKTDRKGQTIGYAYDGYKRLAQKIYPLGGTITSTYQGQGIMSVVDTTLVPNESHSFSYDNSYRIVSETQGPRGVITLTFTTDDRVATMSVSSGPTTTYAYYSDGSLDTIEWSPVVGQFKYLYSLMGQYQTITYPNGQTRSFSYDDQGRLLQLANDHPTAGSLASFVYGYDLDPATNLPTLLGQRTSLNLAIPSQSLTNALSTYRYDGNYQLIQANYPTPAPFNGETHAWTYDGIGNRLNNTVNGTTQTYAYFKNGSNPLNGQRLSSDGINAYTYDANGNTRTRNGTPDSLTFGWDYNDRMTSITGSATASYACDVQGRRSSKMLVGGTTRYLFDGLNIVRTSGAKQVDYLFGPSIDEPLAMSTNGIISYFSIDGLGSVTLLSDVSGNAQSSILYDAWGIVKSQTGTLVSDFGYTAREVGEVGLWFYRARYYQAGIGRFIAEDSWGAEDGPSLYAYVSNRPVMYRDPSGHKVVNNSCQRIYVKSGAGDNVLVIIPQGGSADADGFYNVTPDSCSGFCGRGPGENGSPFPEVRKINDWTDVVITGGCNGGCLEWSYSGAASGAGDMADPWTGWKGGGFFAKHPDWPKPPAPPTPCCASMNWVSSGS